MSWKIENIDKIRYWSQLSWYAIFAFSLSEIWLIKNAHVIDSSQSLEYFSIGVLSTAGGFVAVSLPINKFQLLTFTPVAWCPSLKGWLKLNINDLSLKNPNRVGANTLIWDHYGKWIIGSYKHIPRAISVEVELWALRDDIQLAKSLNFDNIEVYIDATTIIYLRNPNIFVIFYCAL